MYYWKPDAEQINTDFNLGNDTNSDMIRLSTWKTNSNIK